MLAGHELPVPHSQRVRPQIIKVVGNLGSFIGRLASEFVKSLQQIDPHTNEYLERIRDEQSLTHVAQMVLQYYRRAKDTPASVLLASMLMEHK